MACNEEFQTTRMKHYFGERLLHVYSLVTIFCLNPLFLYYLNNVHSVCTGLKKMFKDMFTEI